MIIESEADIFLKKFGFWKDTYMGWLEYDGVKFDFYQYKSESFAYSGSHNFDINKETSIRYNYTKPDDGPFPDLRQAVFHILGF